MLRGCRTLWLPFLRGCWRAWYHAAPAGSQGWPVHPKQALKWAWSLPLSRSRVFLLMPSSCYCVFPGCKGWNTTASGSQSSRGRAGAIWTGHGLNLMLPIHGLDSSHVPLKSIVRASVPTQSHCQLYPARSRPLTLLSSHCTSWSLQPWDATGGADHPLPYPHAERILHICLAALLTKRVGAAASLSSRRSPSLVEESLQRMDWSRARGGDCLSWSSPAKSGDIIKGLSIVRVEIRTHRMSHMDPLFSEVMRPTAESPIMQLQQWEWIWGYRSGMRGLDFYPRGLNQSQKPNYFLPYSCAMWAGVAQVLRCPVGSPEVSNWRPCAAMSGSKESAKCLVTRTREGRQAVQPQEPVVWLHRYHLKTT